MWPLVLILAALGYVVLTRPRFPGDRAQVGDEVLVPPSALAQSGVTIPGLIPQTAFVGIRVSAASRDTLQGRPVTAQGIPVLPPLPDVVVARSAVTRVVRQGRVL